jgi:hypothetical protein
MPRDGAYILADCTSPMLELVCRKCDRAGRFSVARLIAEHGADMRLPNLRHRLAKCPRTLPSQRRVIGAMSARSNTPSPDIPFGTVVIVLGSTFGPTALCPQQSPTVGDRDPGLLNGPGFAAAQHCETLKGRRTSRIVLLLA